MEYGPGLVDPTGRIVLGAVNWACRTRTCRPDVQIFSGLAAIGDKRNKEARGVWVDIWACNRCGRQLAKLWDKRRIDEFKALKTRPDPIPGGV